MYHCGIVQENVSSVQIKKMLIVMVYNFCRKKLKFQPITNLDRSHIEINSLRHNDDHYVTIKDCDSLTGTNR